MRFRHALMSAVLVLSLSAAGLAVAQTGPGAGSDDAGNRSFGYGPGMMGGYGAGMMDGYGPGMMFGGRGPGRWAGPSWMRDQRTAQSMVDGRLAFLKGELAITAQQMPLWNKYAEAMEASVKTMYDRHRDLFQRDWANTPLPQRLDAREQAMAAALDAMRQSDAALKPLYAALDENQKKIADDVMGYPMGSFNRMF